MNVWIAVIQSDGDEDGLYGFTNENKARQFLLDAIVEAHKNEPSKKVEEIVENAKQDFQLMNEYIDWDGTVYYYKCVAVD